MMTVQMRSSGLMFTCLLFASCGLIQLVIPTHFAYADEIRSTEQSESVNPGINKAFLDPELSIDDWLEKFEVESREVYRARDAIAEAMQIRSGDRVADVGAGTGFFSALFHDRVGEDGWVYAVELSPKFAEHLKGFSVDRSLYRMTTVLCRNRSVCLPPRSIDLAFACDVYHHFEFPLQTVRSIKRALRPGGRFIVIDFERIPEVSRQWTLDHVRAGKQTFIDEIQAAGLVLSAERSIEGFEDNYFLVFTKPIDDSGDGTDGSGK